MTQPPPSAKSNKNYNGHTCPSSTRRARASVEGLTENGVGSGKGVIEEFDERDNHNASALSTRNP